MLREDKKAGFVKYRFWWLLWTPRYRFHAGKVYLPRYLTQSELDAIWLRQEAAPELIMRYEQRTWWLHRNRFYWEDDDLSAEDVMALIHQRERRKRQQLDRAHSLMAIGTEDRRAARGGIPHDVKREVWQLCGGRCTNCGSTELLEYDHIIPLAMGGSNTVRNLQLLCADCNRAKGAGLIEPRPDPFAKSAKGPEAALDTRPAGWYPDPQATNRLRWWDGFTWTEHTHD